jgi:hypothetical protein
LVGPSHGFLYSGGQFQSLDYPHATNTYSMKITAAGDIAGYYTAKNNTTHGFVLSNGIYTSIDYPKAAQTYAYGLNDLGEIVGSWTDSAGKTHGFYAVKQ